MPDAPADVTSTPAQPYQPWDATSEGSAGKWASVDAESGPADMTTGRATGDFEDGPGPWRQT